MLYIYMSSSNVILRHLPKSYDQTQLSAKFNKSTQLPTKLNNYNQIPAKTYNYTQLPAKSNIFEYC